MICVLVHPQVVGVYFQYSFFLVGKPIFSKSLMDLVLISWIFEFISVSSSKARKEETIFSLSDIVVFISNHILFLQAA